MPYSQFTIDIIQETFGFTIYDEIGIFTDVPAEYSTLLAQTLKEYIFLAVAIGTEKARSEFIIAPIIFEVKKQLVNRISLFSGKEFNVAPEQGLSGFCDFIISLSPEQLFIQAPVVTIVEAKNDNIQLSLGQCIAEMIAAKLFNERKQNQMEIIYGVVTTGSVCKFMRLIEQRIEVDLDEYFIQDIGKILGILGSFVDV